MGETMMGKDLVVTMVGLVLSGLMSALGTIVLMAWRSIRNELRISRTAQHNNMRLIFSLLAELHKDKADVILKAMEQFMRQSPRPNGGNGAAFTASAGF